MIILEACCIKFVHSGGFINLARASCSPVARLRAAAEKRENPATTAALTSCEPGFWLTGAPTVEVY